MYFSKFYAKKFIQNAADCLSGLEAPWLLFADSGSWGWPHAPHALLETPGADEKAANQQFLGYLLILSNPLPPIRQNSRKLENSSSAQFSWTFNLLEFRETSNLVGILSKMWSSCIGIVIVEFANILLIPFSRFDIQDLCKGMNRVDLVRYRQSFLNEYFQKSGSIQLRPF